jgi:hypothetical protein
MPVINLTAADIAKSKNLEAGWYLAKIVKVHDLTPSAKKDSMNSPVDFEIKNQIAEGKVITVTFNSKAMGMITPLLKAINPNEEVVPGTINTDILMGKEVDVHIVIDNFEGRLLNKIDGYLPKGVGSVGATAY